MKIGFTFLASVALAAVPAVALAQDATSAAPAVVASQGKTLYGAGGTRLGAIYRVAADGSPQLIVEGKLVTVPVATLTSQDGKVMTSLSRKELRSVH